LHFLAGILVMSLHFLADVSVTKLPFLADKTTIALHFLALNVSDLYWIQKVDTKKRLKGQKCLPFAS
jgi:hypothetical protein